MLFRERVSRGKLEVDELNKERVLVRCEGEANRPTRTPIIYSCGAGPRSFS
jgi:hypothetical protein